MLAQGAGDLLHGPDAGAHGLAAPLIEELAASCSPKLLKGFLEKVGPDGLQVVAEEIAQSDTPPQVKIVFRDRDTP